MVSARTARGGTIMDISLFTTTIYKDAPDAALSRLMDSVSASLADAAPRRVELTLLMQNCPNGIPIALPPFVEAIALPGIVSLSAARNILIDHAMARDGFASDTIVAFPDDDAWYPAGFLRQLAALFEARSALDFWFCRYGSAPVEADIAALVRPADARTVVRNASSNTIVFRGKLMWQLGNFDENLGLGTPNVGGEDLDYALKAFARSRETLYADAPLVGHRDKETGLRTKYYPGSIMVLGRHARSGPGQLSEYLRKIAVGAYLVGRRELSPRRFVDCNREAARELLSRRS